MKSTILKTTALAAIFFSGLAQAQEQKFDNFSQRDQRGINQFESPKDSVTTFEKLKVRVGGAFALQFQGVKHESGADQSKPATQLYNIGNNFNLPTANLDIDVALYDGVNLHLRTFLSSRHHNETYV